MCSTKFFNNNLSRKKLSIKCNKRLVRYLCSYEAYVLYLFTQLIIEYLGGEYPLICLLITKRYLIRPWPMNKIKPIQLGEGFYRNVKQGVLQFVIIRPITSVFALILAGWDLYTEGDFSLNNGYLYCSLISNISISISLYYLVLLYTATHDNLDPSIIYKFLCVKSLIFFSFWQSCLFSILLQTGFFGRNELATLYSIKSQNLLLCIELSIATYYYWKSFGFKEFITKQKREYSVIKSVGQVLNVRDIFSDAHNIFVETIPKFEYSDYTWED